jgi:hypothetical protein
MPQKLTKTRAELETLLMAELRKDPVCSSVEAIAITGPGWQTLEYRRGA